MKINKFVDEYISYCEFERRFSIHTIDAYRRDLNHYFKVTGATSIRRAIKVEQLKRYLICMLQDLKLSEATARRHLACLRGFCQYLAERHNLNNPFIRWSPNIKRPKRLPRALPRKSVRSLVKLSVGATQIETETVFCILLLSATGLRVSELCGIRVCDVSLDGTSAHVRGKGDKERVVFVGNKKIASMLVERRRDREKVSGVSANLLLNSRADPLQPQTLRRRIHRLTDRRGQSSPITPHRLRHTAATLLLEKGADIRFVQRQLGHSSISTTELYTQVTDGALKKAIMKADPMDGLVV